MATPTETVIDRLATCWGEVTGIRQVYTAPPSEPLAEDANLPAAVISVGASAVPSSVSRNHIVQQRQFNTRVYLAPINEGVDQARLGAEAYRQGYNLFDYAHQYFADHPQLQTNAGGEGAIPQAGLAAVSAIRTTDGGIVPRTAPGGSPYWCIEFQQIISISALTECVFT